MQRHNLPVVDFKYWLVILIASLTGTTFGDYLSSDLKLGYAGALIPLAVALAVILLCERRALLPNVGYYWAAIVITRTAATDLADLVTHQLKFGFGTVAAILGVALGLFLFVSRGQGIKTAGKVLAAADARYWFAILLASTLGTTAGDFVSDGLHLGVGQGSLILIVMAALMWTLDVRAKTGGEIIYWLAIVVTRTAGTTMGDYLSGEEGLNLGFGWAALLVSFVLAGALWARRRTPQRTAAPLG